MSELDPAALRATYHRLSDEAVAALHAAGPLAYYPDAWRLLDEEFHARGHPGPQAEPIPTSPALEELGESPAVPTSSDTQDIVTVFASSDSAQVLVAKLLLETEGIPFVTEGEGVQDVVGLGRLFGGFNMVTGPVQLRVRQEDAQLALAVLRDLRTGAGPGLPMPEVPEG